MMTRKRAVTKRDKLLGQLTTLGGVLRGSLLERALVQTARVALR
jgi:hypothetical protein